jgi:nucleoside phosphorylase
VRLSQYLLKEREQSLSSLGRIAQRITRAGVSRAIDPGDRLIMSAPAAPVINCLREQVDGSILMLFVKQRPRHQVNFFVKKPSCPKLILAVVCWAWVARADTIAFLYALETDHKAFSLEAPPLGNPIQVGERSITQHRIGNHRVYAAKMGSGCVVSAVSVATVLTKFPCDLVVSIGPCGALDPELAIGSWARVTKVVGWQLYDSGELEGAPERALFDLLAPPLSCQAVFQELVEPTAPVVAASGEMFIKSPATVETLVRDTSASVVEMNAVGLATACRSHQVPLVIWRVVSDRADETAPEDFRKFVQGYTGVGGQMLADWLKNLPSKADRVEDHPELKKLFEGSAEDR